MSIFDSKYLNPEFRNPDSSTEAVQAEVIEDPPKRKRGRPRKDEQQQQAVQQPTTTEISIQNNNQLPMCQTNEPYQSTYMETNNMLRYAVVQLDTLANDVKSEIDSIKCSKTLRGKPKYLSDLCATASNIISSKISAVREMNAVTTKCHELEIRRLKDIAATASQQDDDKYIADLYNAYINTPIGGMQHPAMRYTSSNVAGNMGALMGGIDMPHNEEQGFANFMQNLTPEQNRMIYGDSSNIETVVVYDPNTGDKMFDVIDTNTGTPVQNYPRPDRGLLDETVIDFNSGIATNSNIGQHWKVVVLGDMINHF